MSTPHALEHYLHYMQGLAAMDSSQQAANSPTFQESPQEHHAHEEAMQVVSQSLNFILSGNKAMYISPDMMQAIFSEMIQHVEHFKKEHAAGNPAAALTRLRASIGPGSHFARKHKNHLDKHHPNHPETHEPHADGKPSGCIHCHASEHQGRVVDPGLAHHFSDHPTVL